MSNWGASVIGRLRRSDKKFLVRYVFMHLIEGAFKYGQYSGRAAERRMWQCYYVKRSARISLILFLSSSPSLFCLLDSLRYRTLQVLKLAASYRQVAMSVLIRCHFVSISLPDLRRKRTDAGDSYLRLFQGSIQYVSVQCSDTPRSPLDHLRTNQSVI